MQQKEKNLIIKERQGKTTLLLDLSVFCKAKIYDLLFNFKTYDGENEA